MLLASTAKPYFTYLPHPTLPRPRRAASRALSRGHISFRVHHPFPLRQCHQAVEAVGRLSAGAQATPRPTQSWQQSACSCCRSALGGCACSASRCSVHGLLRGGRPACALGADATLHYSCMVHLTGGEGCSRLAATAPGCQEPWNHSRVCSTQETSSGSSTSRGRRLLQRADYDMTQGIEFWTLTP